MMLESRCLCRIYFISTCCKAQVMSASELFFVFSSSNRWCLQAQGYIPFLITCDSSVVAGMVFCCDIWLPYRSHVTSCLLFSCYFYFYFFVAMGLNCLTSSHTLLTQDCQNLIKGLVLSIEDLLLFLPS